MTFLHNKPLMWVVGNLIHDLCACVERKPLVGPNRYMIHVYLNLQNQNKVFNIFLSLVILFLQP